MEHHVGQPELPKFSSPEEELQYLRERVARAEEVHKSEGMPVSKEAVISREVISYGQTRREDTLEEHFILENPQYEKSLELLNSSAHREKMREIYRLLAEKGILNALKVVRELNSPHLEGDFHAIIVNYVKTGAIVPGLDKEQGLARMIRKTLYEITLPHAEGERIPTVQQAMEFMQRFYSGMLPADREHTAQHDGFTIEIAMPNYSSDITYYVSIKDERKEQFMQQLFGTFPEAKIEEVPRDYNIFNNHGVSLGSSAQNLRNFAFPIADMDHAENDPMKVLLSSFSKVSRDGEGAAVQFIIVPDRDNISGKIKHALGEIHKGAPLKEALNIPLSITGDLFKSVSGLFKSAPKQKPGEEKRVDNFTLEFKEKALKLLEEKLSTNIVRVNLRIIASAGTRERASDILSSIETSFSQFTSPQGNGLRFVRKEKGDLTELMHNFNFRHRDEGEMLALNLKELATLYHFPITITHQEAPQLKTIKTTNASAPAELPAEGTLIGVNKYRGESREVRLTKQDRLRHLYTLGQTGAGKSVFLKNLAVQDILAGNGVCFIDPHGSDVQDILACIPPERIDDVIYFDPTHMERPFALNMLEYDLNHPEQKIFVVNEMLSIFKTLYSSTPESMGPAFEQYFRYSTLLVMEDPETGNTLLEIPRVMADPAFRNLKLSRCKNPIVVQFWRDIATKTSGESGLQNMIPYITNKFDIFISNEVMRPIIAQEKSSFNFRDIMDSKKIFLVNLAKGKLGEINANLLGLIIVGKFLMAAMSRVDSFGKPLPDFYMYIDEFQNISTPSIAAILSEARKYGLSLNLAHQYIAQLREDIKDAVFGNVGNMVVFRVGTEDAEFLESQFAPVFKASDIMKIENRNAYAKILINGKPALPFNIEMLPPPQGHPEIVDQLKNLSYLKYGRDRKTVDDAIMRRYLSGHQNPAPVAATPSSATPPLGRPMTSPLGAPLTATHPSATPVITQVPPTPILQTPITQRDVASLVSPVSTTQIDPKAESPFAQAFAQANHVSKPIEPKIEVKDADAVFADPFVLDNVDSATSDVS